MVPVPPAVEEVVDGAGLLLGAGTGEETAWGPGPPGGNLIGMGVGPPPPPPPPPFEVTVMAILPVAVRLLARLT